MRYFLITVLLLVTPGILFAQDVGYPKTHFVSVTPTIDTSAYITGDQVGGIMTFTGALRGTNAGYVVSAMISDKSAQTTDIELWLWSASPSGTFTDQAASDPLDADISVKFLGVVKFSSTEIYSASDNGVKYKGNLLLPVQGFSSDTISYNIYGTLVSRGAPTFASTSDLTVKLGISQD